MKRIFGYLKPLLGRMLMGFGIKLAGTVMDLAIPWILAHIIDEVVPTGDRRAIFLWGAGMAWTLADAKTVRASILLTCVSAISYAIAFVPKMLTQ